MSHCEWVETDTQLIMTAVSDKNKLFPPPPFLAYSTSAVLLSERWTVVAEVRQEVEIHSYFPIRLQPLQISRAISVPRTPEVHIWSESWKTVQTGQLRTCLQLEGFLFCIRFHTLVLSESQIFTFKCKINITMIWQTKTKTCSTINRSVL